MSGAGEGSVGLGAVLGAVWRRDWDRVAALTPGCPRRVALLAIVRSWVGVAALVSLVLLASCAGSGSEDRAEVVAVPTVVRVSASGSLDWSAAVGDVVGGLVVVDGVVVAGVSVDGAFSWVGLDARSGDRLWEAPLGDRFPGHLVAAADRVVLFAGSQEEAAVTMVDPADGRVVWEFDVSGGGSLGPVVSGATVVVADSGELRVTGLDVADGSVRWELEMPVVSGAVPVLVGDVVAVDTGVGVVGLTAETGEIVWASPLLGEVVEVVGLGSVVGVVGFGRGGMWLDALDSRGGEVLWSRLDPNLRVLHAEDAEWGSVLTTSSPTGAVSALDDPAAGSVAWRIEDRGAPTTGEPGLVAEGLVLPRAASRASGVVQFHDGRTGEMVWETEVQGRVVVSPVRSEGGVVVVVDGESGASLQELALADGERRWVVPLAAPADHPPVVADGAIFVGLDQ